MESAGRAQPVRSGLALGSGAIRLGWQAGSAGSSGTVSAEWEPRNMHTCTHAHMYSEGNSARDKTQTRGHAAMS